jgi:hypothetical protein
MALGKRVLNKTRFPDEKPKPAPAPKTAQAGTGQEFKTKKNIVVDVELFRRLEKYVYEQKTDFGQSGISNSAVIRDALNLYLTDKGY